MSKKQAKIIWKIKSPNINNLRTSCFSCPYPFNSEHSNWHCQSIILTILLPQFMALFSEMPNEECNLKSILTLVLCHSLRSGPVFHVLLSISGAPWIYGNTKRVTGRGVGRRMRMLDRIVHAWTERQTFFGSNNMRNAREPTTL